MTLIAAYKASLGIAMCADSQETVTQYDEDGQPYEVRVTVQKIEPITHGKYQIAIAGAGNASLIEGFIERAKRALQEQDAVICTQANPASVGAIREKLEATLATFYANDVAACPDIDRNFKLFVAASCPIAQQYALWISENTVLRELRSDRPELMGWEHGLYSDTANRLFAPDMTLPQATLASIYTLTVAKQTSNYVRDPLSVAIITKDGIWMEDTDYVGSMEDRLTDYEAGLNRLFLSCSDTTVSVPDLEDQLEAFKKGAVNLHREHINQQVARTNIDDLFRTPSLRKLPKIPITLMGDGSLVVEHDRDKINEQREHWKKVVTMISSHPRFLKCAACNASVEYVTEAIDGGTVVSHSIANKNATLDTFGERWPIPGSLECPGCKLIIQTDARVVRYRKNGAEEWITP